MSRIPSDVVAAVFRTDSFPRDGLVVDAPSSSLHGHSQTVHHPWCTLAPAESHPIAAEQVLIDSCLLSGAVPAVANWTFLLDAAQNIDAMASHVSTSVRLLGKLSNPGPDLLELLVSPAARTARVTASALFNLLGTTSVLNNSIEALRAWGDLTPDPPITAYVLERYQHLIDAFQHAARAVRWADLWFEVTGDAHPASDVAVAVPRAMMGRSTPNLVEEEELMALNLACAPFLAQSGPVDRRGAYVVVAVPTAALAYIGQHTGLRGVDASLLTEQAAGVALTTWMHSSDLSFEDACTAAVAATA